MLTIDLSGTWKFKAAGTKGALPSGPRTRRWMTGQVPGTVHTDLMANKVIPDPFRRTNENDVQWVDKQQWVYRREFTVPASFLAEKAVQLFCGGLDTYALIMINGRRAGVTSNMFVEHRLNVKRLLKEGKNTIEILFDSPVTRSKALEAKHGPLRVALEPHRVYVRKAQYSFSWDWGPKLTTSGIWRAIALQAYSGGRLARPFARVVSLNRREAVVELTAEIERAGDTHLSMRVTVAGEGLFIEDVMHLRGNRGRCRIRIPDPKLWWPNGMGDQPMYKAIFSLVRDGEDVDDVAVPFAIRTVELIQERDREGKSFVISVNGVKTFCKGADWIPCDSFIPRIADATYETLLGMAKEAHMNMIRVWGGGIYEQDVFYNTCDRLGLMVWQDFMFACGEYPDQPWFLRQVAEEAAEVVTRLRNHPSIVVWCGNNECEWLFCTENPDKTPDEMTGAAIFRDILPSACKALDGTRIYWRSSPFGGGFPNDESNGTHHQWSVWSAWKDYREYEKDTARFVAEFGFQAPADIRTFAEVMLPGDLRVQSPVMEHHNKQVEGPERLYRFQAAHHQVGGDLDEFIYKGQLVQAEALKCAVEHWRRRKFNTAGSLFWQLNDCWPVSSWAVVDSALRPKAGFYYAKKFFAPVLISIAPPLREIWLTNDTMEAVRGRVVVTLRSFDGRIVWKRETASLIPANKSVRALLLPARSFEEVDPARHYLLARLTVKGRTIAENRQLMAEPKHCRFGTPEVQAMIREVREGEYTLTLRSSAFVKNLRLEVKNAAVLFSDNYCDIDAGEPKTLRCTTRLNLSDLRRRLTMRWLTSPERP